MPANPWPARVGPLLLRDAQAGDIEPMLIVRNNPVVNRFMFRTYVEPETFRRESLAVPNSTTDFSCVAELDGQVVVTGMGQPGMPEHTEGLIGYIIDPAFTGRGVGSALARGLLGAAFGRLTGSHATTTPSSSETDELCSQSWELR